MVEQKEVREPIVIPFGSTTTNDATLAVGTTAVTVPGVNGEKVIVHQVTYTDGVETERSVLREEITVQPVTQVTAVGTKQPAPPPPPAPAPAPAPAPKSSGCHSSYSGVCVPIASDVDCAGGGGNGPAYVSGPVQVVGHDEYQLDRDGDGIACD
ncbi:G5 domain-containing protein [Mycetocola sp.]|uniref:G5 domain-containing protein n=1 Tax=Mycetocola sp. TaxID=1871042 RepID=UPI003988CA74